jgi:sortase A
VQVRRVVSGLGRTLIGVGLLILLFVAYQLWGTDISEASKQSTLRQQFNGELHRQSPTTTTTTPQPLTTVAPQPAPPSVAPPSGNPVGIIRIPKIGVDKVVVEGVATEDLHLGPGHYPGTPLPGQLGNAAIAGHRTTYGAPFYDLNQLVPGDLVLITTVQGSFRYSVTRTLVVDPSDVAVVAPTADAELTLTTCNPRFSAAQRLVVKAALMGTPAPTPPPPDHPVRATSAGASNLAGGEGDWVPAMWWGIATLAVGVAVWLLARRLSRRASRVLAYSAGSVALLVVLFFFFENISPLLPASL